MLHMATHISCENRSIKTQLPPVAHNLTSSTVYNGKFQPTEDFAAPQMASSQTEPLGIKSC
jgi:hypothetical protein